MSHIPRTALPDSTLSQLLDGYEFISKRCQRYHSDIFESRLLLRKVVCMQGEAAAKVFYDNEYFQREGAMPTPMKKTLLGQGGVQGLDGEAHRQRKQMFMFLMSQDKLHQIGDLVAKYWQEAIDRWEHQNSVVLFDEVNQILCRAACQWAGVPLPESDVKKMTEDMVAMIEGPATPTIRHWQGRQARNRREGELALLAESIRSGAHPAPEDTAAYVMAWYEDPDGGKLSPRVFAVELLNLIRPIVAIGRFIVFMAHALHRYPKYRQELQSNDEEALKHFVQEVRRFYPFFPAVAALVKKEFDWQGYHFPKGRRVMLDLYGTNHDPRSWRNPELFRPERFKDREEGDFDFIPQGGGSYSQHHRCAGEWMTIELMKVALRQLIEGMGYEVPAQDLSISLSKVPALPKSKFIISNVRYREPPNVTRIDVARSK